MSTITIAISDEHMQQLRERADQFNVSPEELVQASVQELLTRPAEDFSQALNYVLNKNAELYRRLA